MSEYADPTLKPVRFNLKEAQEILKKSGWQDSDGDGILDKIVNGKKKLLQFTAMYPVKNLEKMLSIYQEDLKKIGIRMDLQYSDWALFMKKIDELTYDAYIVGRGYPGQVDFDPRGEWHSKYIGPLEGNAIGYQNKEADRLLDLAQFENNRAKRMKILRKAYSVIASDYPMLFLFNDSAFYYVHTPRIKMEKPNYRYLMGMDYWWIEDEK